MKDVYGVGNAIVDVIAEVDDQFLSELALEKGNMTLVDNEHMAHLEDKLSSAPKKIMSGGSAANTVFAVQPLEEVLHMPAGSQMIVMENTSSETSVNLEFQ